MLPRYQLPIHSPLSWPAIRAGAAAMLGGERSAEATVVERLRAHFSPRAVLRTDSGTAALTLALRAIARTHPGRPVALPAYCCYDIATAADGAGVPVVLYDLDPATLGPDFNSLRSALQAGAAGIVIAHLHGIPVDADQVLGLAREHGAVVIDDAAQGAGAAYRRRPVGTFGSFGILSFGRGKGITGGGGGVLLANDDVGVGAIESLRETLRAAGNGTRTFAATLGQWVLGRPALYALPSALPFLRLGETIYRRPSEPAAASRVSAAILACTWPLAADEAAGRKRRAARLIAALKDGRERWMIRVSEGGEPGYLRLPLVLSPAARAGLPAARRLGVMPGYPKALVDLEGFGPRTRTPHATYSGARRLAERLCTLPTHGLLDEPDLQRLERWLASAPQ